MMLGTVFDIQKFSLHDGPGIRTTVFLKGCPLHCRWCHNPESQSFRPELLFDRQRCIGCQACAAVCREHCHTFRDEVHRLERSRCIGCGHCIAVCPTRALSMAGRLPSSDEIVKTVLEDRLFYEESYGGVTLSGGEPLAQPEFALEILTELQNAGIHTAVETCGAVPPTVLARFPEKVNLWLFDIKAAPEKHQALTGTPADGILSNLRFLAEQGAALILRCPLIPGLNDSEADLTYLADLADRLPGVLALEVEPHHPLGLDKYVKLDRVPQYQGDAPSDDMVRHWLAALGQRCRVPVRKG